jgi:WD40 repeat protein
MFITGCEGGVILRWDAATGERIGEPLPGDIGIVTDLAVAVAPDGRQFLVCLNDKGLHRWDPATGEPIGELIPMDGRFREVITYVDRHGIPSVFVGRSRATGVESVEQWRLDTGERVRAGLPTTLRAVFDADGVEMMALGAADGSLTIRPLPHIIPSGPVVSSAEVRPLS